uniref:Thioredoxin-like fold domain-containing protein n=1 Tax=Daucus carota subsp. sativus TaxID=79200 RepID=A0A166EHT0_DAUCS
MACHPLLRYACRNSLEKKLRLPVSCVVGEIHPLSVVVDPAGVVLQTYADGFFSWFGPRAYPFSDKRIERLRREDRDALNHPSISKLLNSPHCSYVINNQNQEVPVHDLEDKVVALYFYEEHFSSTDLTTEIQTAYNKLLAKKKNFEIVLVYVYDSIDTSEYATEEIRIILEDIQPNALAGTPNFGISAYPFTRTRVAKREAKYLKKLRLDMFWDPNTSFTQNNGREVKLSQLVGKKIILVVDGDWGSAKFLRRLRSRFLETKETDNAFEVIYVSKIKGPSSGKHFVASMPWLRHPPLRRRSRIAMLLGRFREAVGIVAFDGDGTVVRRSTSPSIEKGNKDFPFYSGGLEEEALMEFTEEYNWDYLPAQVW